MSILPLGKIVRLTCEPKICFSPPRNVVHPELHFVTHIPQTIPGEQLIAQLFRCVPEKSWLFKYGCVPMSFILPDWVWRVSFLFPLFYHRL
jgi:hypothetical protein